MSTFMIGPDARLAERYQLNELINELNGAALWKAKDETLARPVAVWTFGEDFPRTYEVVRAARAASRITDSRVAQVFDADDSGPIPYVVEEWVAGQSLEALLAQGPLEVERATGLIAEAAEAIASANAAGIFHLCLTPRKVIWSFGGAVKITGASVDATIRGVTAEEPAVVDATALGKLLYAALTGYWPGDTSHQLPPAPIVSERTCEPIQIRAGIPERINGLACRAAFQTGSRHGAPPRSAQEIADELADTPRLVPLPTTPAGPAAGEPQGTSRTSGRLSVPSSEPPPTRRRDTPRTLSSTPNKALVGTVVLLVFVAVAVTAWTVGSNWNGYGTASNEESQEPTAEETTELTGLEPASLDGFDPEGDGSEHGENAGEAIDGDPATAWSTEGYKDKLSLLKSGVGLLVDMGEPVNVHELEVTLAEASGTDMEVRVGDRPQLDSLTPVWSETGLSGEVPIELSEPAEGRYVVLWFTELPMNDGDFRGSIHEVELRGNK